MLTGRRRASGQSSTSKDTAHLPTCRRRPTNAHTPRTHDDFYLTFNNNDLTALAVHTQPSPANETHVCDSTPRVSEAALAHLSFPPRPPPQIQSPSRRIHPTQWRHLPPQFSQKSPVFQNCSAWQTSTQPPCRLAPTAEKTQGSRLKDTGHPPHNKNTRTHLKHRGNHRQSQTDRQTTHPSLFGLISQPPAAEIPGL